jgi:hypothetical protein
MKCPLCGKEADLVTISGITVCFHCASCILDEFLVEGNWRCNGSCGNHPPTDLPVPLSGQE